MKNNELFLLPMIVLIVYLFSYAFITNSYSVKVIPHMKVESATAKYSLGNEVREVSAEVTYVDKDTWKITVPQQVFHNVICQGEIK